MITNKLRFVEGTDCTVAERKKELRAYMKARRGENENRDVKAILAMENLFRVIGQTAGAGTRRNIFVYLSFSSELSTDKLVERLQEEGFGVYCPRIENGEMKAAFCEEDFTLSKFGVREPLGKVLKTPPDFIVLPLLAADEKGNRLGYGGGYYDEYLRKYPSAKRIGYCFDFQIVKDVPHAETDEPLDVVVTEKRVLYTSARA